MGTWISVALGAVAFIGYCAWAVSGLLDLDRLTRMARVSQLPVSDGAYEWVQRHSLRLLPVMFVAGMWVVTIDDKSPLNLGAMLMWGVTSAAVGGIIMLIVLAFMANYAGLYNAPKIPDDEGLEASK